MEKRKTRGSREESTAVVKAAAWAWYQHGSGSEENPTREYDVTIRARHAPRPSRYKLEAALGMRNMGKEGGLVISASTTHHNDREKPIETHSSHNLGLLDAYEIRSISRQLDSLIEHSSIKANYHKDSFSDDNDDDDDDSNSCSSSNSIGMTCNLTKQKKKKTMKKLMRGFWLRHAAVCGTKEDVVETVMTRPSAAMAATCRPWNITLSR